MNIDFYIDTQNKLINNSENTLYNSYCTITDNIIDLYANTEYNFNFKSNNTILHPVENILIPNYYFVIFYDYNYYSININNINYIYGISNIVFDSNNIINTYSLFNLNDLNYNYTYTVFKYENNVYNEFISGKIRINYPLIFINLIINNTDLINDNNSDLINININEKTTSTKQNIILYENYNYIFNITNQNKLFLHIYLDSYLLTEESDSYSILKIKNIPKQTNINFKWNISTLNYSGILYFSSHTKNISSGEKLEDYKFKNIVINNKFIFNNFQFNEFKNIKYLRNSINTLELTDSHKFLIIDGNNKNITIILPSSNVFIGLSYTILLLQDLNSINIYFEDHTEILDNYDKIKGSLFLNNINNLYNKTMLSSNEIISSNNIETNLSEDIIIKKIKLNNGSIYNGGLMKYGLIKINCLEYINNKYIWNCNGNLLGNSILYSNTYLYTPFI